MNNNWTPLDMSSGAQIPSFLNKEENVELLISTPDLYSYMCEEVR